MSSAHHPSALRNRVDILEKLADLLPQHFPILAADVGEDAKLNCDGLTALEVASGTGAHIEVFAGKWPNISWQPTEYIPTTVDTPDGSDIGRIGFRNAPVLEVIDQFGSSKFSNVVSAKALDMSKTWPEFVPRSQLDLVFASNCTHITPFSCTEGLFAGAGECLRKAGLLIIYGPFKIDNQFTTDSNRAFDESLRQRNTLWGYWDVAELEGLATAQDLELIERLEMKANNFMLVFKKI